MGASDTSSSGRAEGTKISDSSDSNKEDPSASTREPFLAFVPQVGSWAGGIAAGELKIATNATVGFPTWFGSFLGETFSFYKANPDILFSEVISGFTVAIMQVPESIAFSFVAGVPPLSGLQATFWMALITGIFGGKPGMISGKYQANLHIQ